MAKKKMNIVDCEKYPNHAWCEFIADVKNSISGSNPIGEELLELLEQFQDALGSDEEINGDLVLSLADLLRQLDQQENALWLLDIMPRLLPVLTTPEDTLILSEGLLLRARILDRMPERAVEADNAFALANHFAVIAGRLERS